MTSKEFNEKYKDYLEEDHYGLSLERSEAIEYLDNKFQEFIKEPDFKYSQIKGKFNFFCFYCKGLGQRQVNEVTNTLARIYSKEDEG